MSIKKLKRRVPFDKETVFDQAMAILNKQGGIVSISDLIAFLPCEKTTFFKLFPNGSAELDKIHQAMDESKRKAVVSLRGKLYNSNNPTAWLALYKMICTDEERAVISMVKADITTNGKELRQDPITIEVIDSRDKVAKEDNA